MNANRAKLGHVMRFVSVIVSGASAALLAHAAVAADGGKLPSPLFNACGKAPKELHAGLAKIGRSIEEWARKRSAKELASPDLDGTREGRLTLLYAPFLLPKGAPFADVYQDCWSFYVDFKKALAAGDRSEAGASFNAWDGCVKTNFEPYPAEAGELVDCWKKSSAK